MACVTKPPGKPAEGTAGAVSDAWRFVSMRRVASGIFSLVQTIFDVFLHKMSLKNCGFLRLVTSG